jgi:hypothetical protein
MQASPFHSQRQLVSGKVGWGWRQATYPISANFGFAGCLMMVMAIAQLIRTSEFNGEFSFVAFVGAPLLVGFVIGIYTTRSIVEVCRQNTEYLFSQWQAIGITSYWLVLIAGLNSYSETASKSFVAIWWILPAAAFIGISSTLMVRSAKSKVTDTNIRKAVESSQNNDLNIVIYSDQTVLVSPSSLAQQPRQFNSLILFLLGLFFWTMLDLSSSIRAIVAMAFTMTGLVGFFTWQVQLRSPEKLLHLKYSGLWGIEATYTIDLRPFSRLSIVKLQEANGELSWTQLAGGNSEITLPLAITMLVSQDKKDGKEEVIDDQFCQTLREEFLLAKQETHSDSLGLAHVLLPQGAGILAGMTFTIIGGLVLIIFPITSQLSVSSTVGWLGVCMVCPEISRFLLRLFATHSLQSDHASYFRNKLQSWEIGTAILLVSTFLTTQTSKATSFMIFNQSLPTLTLICGWLSMGIGICLFAFVRRTPLWNNN